MKKYLNLIFLTVFTSCVLNLDGPQQAKYSKEDLLALNDSTKNLYYKDAAYIDFLQMIKDSVKRYEQIGLNGQNIMSYYDDLINIYNSSYAISNSFFENISQIHTFLTPILYYRHVSADTGDVWAKEWINGNTNTGITGIDSLIEDYNIKISFSYEYKGSYYFTLIFKRPINYHALRYILQKTNVPIGFEPNILLGDGSIINFSSRGNQRIYEYIYRWGDCPAGCINSHNWKIQVTDQAITLLEESGDPL